MTILYLTANGRGSRWIGSENTVHFGPLDLTDSIWLVPGTF